MRFHSGSHTLVLCLVRLLSGSESTVARSGGRLKIEAQAGGVAAVAVVASDVAADLEAASRSTSPATRNTPSSVTTMNKNVRAHRALELQVPQILGLML